jgi:hypothetical protein
MGASAAFLEGNKPINPQVFLGAGFSATAGVPLASQLFDSRPLVDRITRRKLVDRVVAGWERWSSCNGGSPEEYLAYLQKAGGRDWVDAQWYVGLVVALAMGRVQYVGLKPTITRHNIGRTTQVPMHEDFCAAMGADRHERGKWRIRMSRR